MRFDIITLFPEMFAALKCGITGRAIENRLIELHTWNPRDYTFDNYSKVDHRPYGGGPGMVMLVEPLRLAIQAAKSAVQAAPAAKSSVAALAASVAAAEASANRVLTVYLSPQGKPLTQNLVQDIAIASQSGKSSGNLILLCGRYEGIDERLIELEVDEEWSIGDYVLSGGELAAMVVIDAVTRLLPGAIGEAESAQQDSFGDGLLDYQHYTRPEEIAGKTVPKVLLSGDHKSIARWRRQQALGRTWLRRPDLLQKLQLTEEDTMLLNAFISERNKKGEL